MKEKFRKEYWWTWFCNEIKESGLKEEPEVSEKPRNEVADAIKTLAWCIFWGLVIHGCAVGHITIQTTRI